MSDLELPEPLFVDKNIATKLDELEKRGETIFSFEGDMFISTLFELFLIKKYKSNFLVLAGKQPKKLIIGKFIGVSFHLKSRYTKADQQEMINEFSNISKQLVECIKKGEKTIIIPFWYTLGMSGHANVLIYRKDLNQLEHFEPHGGGFRDDPSKQNSINRVIASLINVVNSYFKKNDIQQVKYIDASQVCPYIKGLQTLEIKSILKRKKNEPPGYCAAWSMFFSELCLKNPELSSSEIMNNIYNYLTTKPSAEDYLKKVIRGYAGYIFVTVNKYLEIFFKPKLTVDDLINYGKTRRIDKLIKLDKALGILTEIESRALLYPDFNLEKELKEVKKIYRQKTKGLTQEEERNLRNANEVIANLYYKKRILQNYEEYKNYGKITEPIFDTPIEIHREEIINPTVITKGKPIERQPIQRRRKTEEERRLEQEEFIKEYKKLFNSLENKLPSPHSSKSSKNKKTSPNSKTKRKHSKKDI